MGLLDKLFGEKRDVVREGEMVVLRKRELAEQLTRPEEPNFSDETPGPCETCAKTLAEVLITTGGPLGDAELWRDVPVAVDGWACVDCGVFRYPRKLSAERSTQLTEDGATHGRAGRFAEAELCFARVVWAWPGYVMAHVNYAEATRERLHRTGASLDAQVRRRLEARMLEQLEAAVAGHAKKPLENAVPAVAHACVSIAELAVANHAFERARRYLDALLELAGVPEAASEKARELARYIDTRHDLFEAAAKVLMPRIELADRPARPPETPEQRKAVVDAMAKLEEHIERAPDRWQAAWLRAKAMFVLGKTEEGFDAWREASERFPDEADLARDYSMALLKADRCDEARAVARAIAERHPADATLWCNLSVTELLCGDLDAAQAALARSRSLDASDVVAKTVEERLALYRAGRALPKTLRELTTA